MNISFKDIALIIIASILVGFIYNSLNPKGISLIKEKKELVFESDSLLLSIDQEVETIDSIKTSEITEKELIPKGNNVRKDSVQKKEENKIIIEPFTEPKAIKIDLAYKLYQQGVKFIDARMPDEYSLGHIKGAYNIPFDGDESYREILNNFSKEEILVVYCGGTDCDLSFYLGNELSEKGFKRVYVFFGGWNEWIENDYPISKN